MLMATKNTLLMIGQLNIKEIIMQKPNIKVKEKPLLELICGEVTLVDLAQNGHKQQLNTKARIEKREIEECTKEIDMEIKWLIEMLGIQTEEDMARVNKKQLEMVILLVLLTKIDPMDQLEEINTQLQETNTVITMTQLITKIYGQEDKEKNLSTEKLGIPREKLTVNKEVKLMEEEKLQQLLIKERELVEALGDHMDLDKKVSLTSLKKKFLIATLGEASEISSGSSLSKLVLNSIIFKYLVC